jgi:hypothetical protein
VIDITTIPMTDEPMEGVAFDVQDHTRWTSAIWTGTNGEMISSDLHGAEEPTRWMLRPHQGAETGQSMDQGFCTREEEDVPSKALRKD